MPLQPAPTRSNRAARPRAVRGIRPRRSRSERGYLSEGQPVSQCQRGECRRLALLAAARVDNGARGDQVCVCGCHVDSIVKQHEVKNQDAEKSLTCRTPYAYIHQTRIVSGTLVIAQAT